MSKLKQPKFASFASLFFVSLLVAALVTSQVISSKLLAITLPVVGFVSMPGGTLAYAFTFFSTDTMSELYGKEFARKAVNVAFFMNFVLFALIWVTVQIPAAEHSIDPEMFETVLMSSGNIVLGSLGAYIVSQNFDVWAFHKYREWTDGDHLWLRNIGSTGISQFIDTAIFTVVAFWIAPQIFGFGHTLPWTVIWTLIVGQYFAKLLIAFGDTPLVYAAVGAVKRAAD